MDTFNARDALGLFQQMTNEPNLADAAWCLEEFVRQIPRMESAKLQTLVLAIEARISSLEGASPEANALSALMESALLFVQVHLPSSLRAGLTDVKVYRGSTNG